MCWKLLTLFGHHSLDRTGKNQMDFIWMHLDSVSGAMVSPYWKRFVTLDSAIRFCNKFKPFGHFSLKSLPCFVGWCFVCDATMMVISTLSCAFISGWLTTRQQVLMKSANRQSFSISNSYMLKAIYRFKRRINEYDRFDVGYNLVNLTGSFLERFIYLLQIAACEQRNLFEIRSFAQTTFWTSIISYQRQTFGALLAI